VDVIEEWDVEKLGLYLDALAKVIKAEAPPSGRARR